MTAMEQTMPLGFSTIAAAISANVPIWDSRSHLSSAHVVQCLWEELTQAEQKEWLQVESNNTTGVNPAPLDARLAERTTTMDLLWKAHGTTAVYRHLTSPDQPPTTVKQETGSGPATTRGRGRGRGRPYSALTDAGRRSRDIREATRKASESLAVQMADDNNHSKELAEERARNRAEAEDWFDNLAPSTPGSSSGQNGIAISCSVTVSGLCNRYEHSGAGSSNFNDATPV
jgi:hypothetical protein